MLLDMEGDVVPTMIKEGRRIVEEAIEQYQPSVVLAAFSGGNDSIVSTYFAAQEFGATVVHCNTGTGLKATREHVHRCVDRFRWEFEELFADECRTGKPGPLDESTLPSGHWEEGDNAYEDFVLNHGFPGPAQHARMFQRLKERPLAAFIRRVRKPRSKEGPVMILSGIRRDESAIRAGYKRAIQREESNPRVWVNPFYWRTSVDFEVYRQEFGLPRNPVKARVGVSGECNCGSFASSNPGELEAIRSVDPGFAAYLDRLSERVKAKGFPWGWGELPPGWWAKARKDARNGQTVMFDLYGVDGDEPDFLPMCVGCPMKRR